MKAYLEAELGLSFRQFEVFGLEYCNFYTKQLKMGLFLQDFHKQFVLWVVRLKPLNILESLV